MKFKPGSRREEGFKGKSRIERGGAGGGMVSESKLNQSWRVNGVAAIRVTGEVYTFHGILCRDKE